ncbi:hypothetical protein JCM11641_006152 [Rhodosporidiobolus odoratus]
MSLPSDPLPSSRLTQQNPTDSSSMQAGEEHPIKTSTNILDTAGPEHGPTAGAHPVSLKATSGGGSPAGQMSVDERERRERDGGGQASLEKITTGLGGMILTAPLAALEKVSPSFAHNLSDAASSVAHRVQDYAGSHGSAAIGGNQGISPSGASARDQPGDTLGSAADTGRGLAQSAKDATLGGTEAVKEKTIGPSPASAGALPATTSPTTADLDATIARTRAAREEAHQAVQEAQLHTSPGTGTTPANTTSQLGDTARSTASSATDNIKSTLDSLASSASTGPYLSSTATAPHGQTTQERLAETAQHALDTVRHYLPASVGGSGLATSVPPFEVVEAPREHESTASHTQPAGARDLHANTAQPSSAQVGQTTSATGEQSHGYVETAKEKVRDLGNVAAGYLPSQGKQEEAANNAASTASTAGHQAQHGAALAAGVASSAAIAATHGVQQGVETLKGYLPERLDGTHIETTTGTAPDHSIGSASHHDSHAVTAVPSSSDWAEEKATVAHEAAHVGAARMVEIGGPETEKVGYGHRTDSPSATSVAGNVAGATRDAGARAYDTTASTLASGAEKARETAQQAYNTTASTLGSGVEQAKSTASQAYDSAASTLGAGAEKTREVAQGRAETVRSQVPDLSRLRGDSAYDPKEAGTAKILGREEKHVPVGRGMGDEIEQEPEVPAIAKQHQGDEHLSLTQRADPTTAGMELGKGVEMSRKHDEPAATAQSASLAGYSHHREQDPLEGAVNSRPHSSAAVGSQDAPQTGYERFAPTAVGYGEAAHQVGGGSARFVPGQTRDASGMPQLGVPVGATAATTGSTHPSVSKSDKVAGITQPSGTSYGQPDLYQHNPAPQQHQQQPPQVEYQGSGLPRTFSSAHSETDSAAPSSSTAQQGEPLSYADSQSRRTFDYPSPSKAPSQIGEQHQGQHQGESAQAARHRESLKEKVLGALHLGGESRHDHDWQRS